MVRKIHITVHLKLAVIRENSWNRISDLRSRVKFEQIYARSDERKENRCRQTRI